MIKRVSVKGYEFSVDFDYQPYDRPTFDYPGCDEDVDINEVTDYDGDVVKDYAFDALEEDFRIACLEAVHYDQDWEKQKYEMQRQESYEAWREIK